VDKEHIKDFANSDRNGKKKTHGISDKCRKVTLSKPQQKQVSNLISRTSLCHLPPPKKLLCSMCLFIHFFYFSCSAPSVMFEDTGVTWTKIMESAF